MVHKHHTTSGGFFDSAFAFTGQRLGVFVIFGCARSRKHDSLRVCDVPNNCTVCPGRPITVLVSNNTKNKVKICCTSNLPGAVAFSKLSVGHAMKIRSRSPPSNELETHCGARRKALVEMTFDGMSPPERSGPLEERKRTVEIRISVGGHVVSNGCSVTIDYDCCSEQTWYDHHTAQSSDLSGDMDVDNNNENNTDQNNNCNINNNSDNSNNNHHHIVCSPSRSTRSESSLCKQVGVHMLQQQQQLQVHQQQQPQSTEGETVVHDKTWAYDRPANCVLLQFDKVTRAAAQGHEPAKVIWTESLLPTMPSSDPKLKPKGRETESTTLTATMQGSKIHDVVGRTGDCFTLRNTHHMPTRPSAPLSLALPARTDSLAYYDDYYTCSSSSSSSSSSSCTITTIPTNTSLTSTTTTTYDTTTSATKSSDDFFGFVSVEQQQELQQQQQQQTIIRDMYSDVDSNEFSCDLEMEPVQEMVLSDGVLADEALMSCLLSSSAPFSTTTTTTTTTATTPSLTNAPSRYGKSSGAVLFPH